MDKIVRPVEPDILDSKVEYLGFIVPEGMEPIPKFYFPEGTTFRDILPKEKSES